MDALRLAETGGLERASRAWRSVADLSYPSGTAAAVYRELGRSGQMIGKADLYIAGICIASDAQILTRNTREYSRVPRLELTKV